ncbi:hypothetical protein, partial [Listeria monocytogenes]|uniref:hypothetical protein n=1 Tax=Listeria monocytogenes TaxID=1639 RepID=UPI0015576B89
AELKPVGISDADPINVKAKLRVEVLLGDEKLSGEYHLVTNIQGKKDKQQIKITL